MRGERRVIIHLRVAHYGETREQPSRTGEVSLEWTSGDTVLALDFG